MVIPSVDELDHKTVFVFLHTVGIIIEVEANPHLHSLFTNASSTLKVKLNGSSRIRFRQVDAFKVHIAVSRRAAGLRDTLDGNLLDQTLVVCFHCVQPVNHVVNAVRLVGGGVAQGKKGIKLFQTLLCLLTFHRLRFVYDENRIGFCNNVNGATGTELIQLHINASGILALCIECL